jgi:hypothetical protein
MTSWSWQLKDFLPARHKMTRATKDNSSNAHGELVRSRERTRRTPRNAREDAKTRSTRSRNWQEAEKRPQTVHNADNKGRSDINASTQEPFSLETAIARFLASNGCSLVSIRSQSRTKITVTFCQSEKHFYCLEISIQANTAQDFEQIDQILYNEAANKINHWSERHAK